MRVLVIKGTVSPCFRQDLGVIHPPALAESSIVTNGVRYNLALAAPATSTVSGCAVNCQSVIMTLGMQIIGSFSLHE